MSSAEASDDSHHAEQLGKIHFLDCDFFRK
jgi:hypothetical protein